MLVNSPTMATLGFRFRPAGLLVLFSCTPPNAEVGTGRETSACVDYECLTGLVCLSNVCVDPDTEASSGSSVTSSTADSRPSATTTAGGDTDDGNHDSSDTRDSDDTSSVGTSGTRGDDSTSGDGSTGSTPDPVEPYGSCSLGQFECAAGEFCMSSGDVFVCAQTDCTGPSDCPPPPATGTAPAVCGDPWGAGSACYLSCAANTCPGGMVCYGGAWCGWAPCGNGVVDPGEQCDGRKLSGFNCASLGLGVGALSCDRTCSFDTSGCA